MFTEVQNVPQFKGEPSRRWFTDEGFDLIVWHAGDEIVGFQLCCKDATEKRALTWHKGEGASHTMIDDGEGRTFGHKMTPILVPDGSFDARTVLNHFLDSARALDPSIRETVVKVIMDES